MALIRFIDDAGELRTRPIEPGRFLIGRIASCNIVFADDMVSREHSEIERVDDGRFRIKDLGSRNKTFVNGQLIAETVLASGDVIRVGDHVLEYLDDDLPAGQTDQEFFTPDTTDPPGTEWVKARSPVTLTPQQLSRLAGLSQSHTLLVRPDELAWTGLSHLLIDLQAERGFVAFKGEKKREIRVIAQKGLSRSPGEGLMPVSQTFALSALLQQVAGRYPENAAQIDPKAGFAATAMVAPLKDNGETIGVVYIDRPESRKPFTAQELQLFMAAGCVLGSILATGAKRLAQTGQVRGSAAMSALRRTHSLLSAGLPEIEDFRMACSQIPGHGRCGDLADVFIAGEGQLFALIVDAGGAGHFGLALAAAIRSAFRAGVTVSQTAVDLGQIMTAVNASICGLKGRQFIGACSLHVDTRSGRIAYVNAGGCLPVLMPGPTRIQSLDQPSLVLGTDAIYVYEAFTVDLPAQFRLVVHSDGLLDGCNAAGEAFGEERLKNVLLDAKTFAEPGQIAERVIKEFEDHLAGHPAADDVVILVIGQ